MKSDDFTSEREIGLSFCEIPSCDSRLETIVLSGLL